MKERNQVCLYGFVTYLWFVMYTTLLWRMTETINLQIMWSILKSEEEYVKQLDILVNQFQYPCEIATTSHHPPLTLEACKGIFRNW